MISGNPLYTIETTQSLLASKVLAVVLDECQITSTHDTNNLHLSVPLPDTLQGILRSNIDRLPSATQEILQIASVAAASSSPVTLDLLYDMFVGEQLWNQSTTTTTSTTKGSDKKVNEIRVDHEKAYAHVKKEVQKLVKTKRLILTRSKNVFVSAKLYNNGSNGSNGSTESTGRNSSNGSTGSSGSSLLGLSPPQRRGPKHSIVDSIGSYGSVHVVDGVSSLSLTPPPTKGKALDSTKSNTSTARSTDSTDRTTPLRPSSPSSPGPFKTTKGSKGNRVLRFARNELQEIAYKISPFSVRQRLHHRAALYYERILLERYPRNTLWRGANASFNGLIEVVALHFELAGAFTTSAKYVSRAMEIYAR